MMVCPITQKPHAKHVKLNMSIDIQIHTWFATKMWYAKAPQLSTSCWRYLTGKLKGSITRVSLVPRPSQSPVFGCLEYAKMEGGRPGIIYHVNDVSVYLGRQRGEGSLIERTHFTQVFFVLKQERYAFRFANVRNSSAWGRNYKIRALARSFDGGPLPPLSNLGRH